MLYSLNQKYYTFFYIRNKYIRNVRLKSGKSKKQLLMKNIRIIVDLTKREGFFLFFCILDLVYHLFLLFLSCWLATCLALWMPFKNEKIACNHPQKRTKQICCRLCSPSAMLFLFSCSKTLFYFPVHQFLQLRGSYGCFLGKF